MAELTLTREEIELARVAIEARREQREIAASLRRLEAEKAFLLQVQRELLGDADGDQVWPT